MKLIAIFVIITLLIDIHCKSMSLKATQNTKELGKKLDERQVEKKTTDNSEKKSSEITDNSDQNSHYPPAPKAKKTTKNKKNFLETDGSTCKRKSQTECYELDTECKWNSKKKKCVDL